MSEAGKAFGVFLSRSAAFTAARTRAASYSSRKKGQRGLPILLSRHVPSFLTFIANFSLRHRFWIVLLLCLTCKQLQKQAQQRKRENSLTWSQRLIKIWSRSANMCLMTAANVSRDSFCCEISRNEKRRKISVAQPVNWPNFLSLSLRLCGLWKFVQLSFRKLSHRVVFICSRNWFGFNFLNWFLTSSAKGSGFVIWFRSEKFFWRSLKGLFRFDHGIMRGLSSRKAHFLVAINQSRC